MNNFILIDKNKNTIEIDLQEYEFRNIIKNIEPSKIKRHKTLSDLNKEISNFTRNSKNG